MILIHLFKIFKILKMKVLMHHQQDYHLIFSKFIESRDKKFPDIGIGSFVRFHFKLQNSFSW